MPNTLGSNYGTKVVNKFAESFENTIVLSKAIRVSSGKEGLDANTGDTYYIKRPHQHKSIRTPGGDISGETEDFLQSGRIAVTKQDYITVYKKWSDIEQALELNQLDEIMSGVADEMVTELETSLGTFMLSRAGLTYGTPGQPLNSWGDVSGAAALTSAIGAPMKDSCYVMNPFAQSNLSSVQSGLHASSELVSSAWKNATISNNVGGMRCITSNSLKNFQSGATAARSGTLALAPTLTYDAVKDTMIGSLALSGLTASTTNAVRIGDTIEFTGTGADARSYVNINTRETIMGSDGAPVRYRFTVTADADSDGAGLCTAQVTAAPIYETAAGLGAYNNISAALAANDAFTILGAEDTTYQPNLFFAKSAFILDTVSIPKLEAQDATFTTKSGFRLRVSRGSQFLENNHIVRFDLLPAFGCANPLMAGRGFGT